MRRPRRPLFLDPDRYRRRRMMDAARLLPLLGGFLFLLPVLWLPGPSGHNTAVEGVYLFLVWAGLIVLARLFAPGLAKANTQAGQPEPLATDGPEGGSSAAPTRPAAATGRDRG